MARILVTSPLPDPSLDVLVAAGHDLDVREGSWRDALADADALVCQLVDRIDEDVLAAAPRLQVVATVSVGHDHVDLAAAARRGIVVCNTPGVLDDATADLAIALMIMASRLTSEAERFLRDGKWTGWDMHRHVGQDVHGAALGLVGYGRIGRAVARRAAGFGMTVRHHTRHDTGADGWVAHLDDLLRDSDIVSLHVPLSPATTHLIGARELALLRPTAVLVNTARGPVVDEAALAAALHAGTVFAAGLDVYEREPAVHPELLAAPRTVLLPHIGSATVATRRAMAELACGGVLDVLAGRHPANAVPPPAPPPPPRSV